RGSVDRPEELDRSRHARPRGRADRHAHRAPGAPADAQSRYIEAAVSGVLFASFYAPNGNPQPGPKFDYKLTWMKRFTRHAATLYEAGIPVVLAGDTNVVPTDRDIYPTKSYDDALLHQSCRCSAPGSSEQHGLDNVQQ